MTPDFRIHSQDSPSGLVYVVTPQNTRALCWMIARTGPSQRPHHTIAYLDSDSLATFCESAESKKLIVKCDDPSGEPQTLIAGINASWPSRKREEE